MRASCVVVLDDPLGPYPHPRWADMARTVAACVEAGLGDRVAWALICGDVTTVDVDERGRERIQLASPLLAHRVVYGNRGKRKRRT